MNRGAAILFCFYTLYPTPHTLFPYFLPMNQKISDRTMLMRMLVAIGK